MCVPSLTLQTFITFIPHLSLTSYEINLHAQRGFNMPSFRAAFLMPSPGGAALMASGVISANRSKLAPVKSAKSIALTYNVMFTLWYRLADASAGRLGVSCPTCCVRRIYVEHTRTPSGQYSRQSEQ